MKIINYENESLIDISKQSLANELKEYGIILLRGFKCDLEIFSNFIGKMSSRVTCDPARTASAKNTQLIDAGHMKMGLHLENGNAPFVPNLQFFYCEVAPVKLSRTTYCDGYLAAQELEEKLLQELQERQIMYTRNIHWSKLRKYFAVEFQKKFDSIHELNDLLGKDVELIELSPDYIQMRVRRSIVFNATFSGKTVLAHCVNGPSLNYDIPRITWSDGSLISPKILDTIYEIGECLTKPIPYVDGDVVIMDNHRVMHGREKILDYGRKIYGGQGYL